MYSWKWMIFFTLLCKAQVLNFSLNMCFVVFIGEKKFTQPVSPWNLTNVNSIQKKCTWTDCKHFVVCGERSRKRQSDTKHSQSYVAFCKHVAPDLLKFHGLDILFDTPDVHSPTLCCKCYTRLKKLKFSENPSSTTIQNAQSDIEKTSLLWKEFDSSLAYIPTKLYYQSVKVTILQ